MPVPKKKNKGAPPPPEAIETSNTTREDTENTVQLNMTVPEEFKRDLKVYAASKGKTMIAIVQEAFYKMRNQEP